MLFDETVIFFQLVLYLLVLVRFVVEIEIHVGDVLGEDFFEFSHALTPDASGVVDLGNFSEFDELRHFFSELKFERIPYDTLFKRRSIVFLFVSLTFLVFCWDVICILVLFVGRLLFSLNWGLILALFLFTFHFVWGLLSV